jgi:hypothetical protein
MAFGFYTNSPEAQIETYDLQQITTEKGIEDDNGGGR